jgi:hypothetical protein
MFGKLFGKKTAARRGEDNVWASAEARSAGIVKEAERLVGEGAAVVVVALAPKALDELAARLAARSPALCKDVFGQAALRGRLDQPGAPTLALASALPKPAADSLRAGQSTTPVEVLVFGRHDQRSLDDEIVAFADGIGPRARVAFHMSFDDPLLAGHAGAIKGVLERLGMTSNEAIAHPLVTKSIEKAQQRSRPPTE